MKLNRISIIFCLLGLAMPMAASNLAGNTEFLKRNYEGAIVEYKKTIEGSDSIKSKKDAYALYRIGECYSYLNNAEEAVNYLNNAITSGYQEAEAYMVYGKNLQKLGKYQLAKAAFEEVERLQPTNPQVKNLKASCDFALRFSSQNPISPEEYISGINTTDMEYGIGFYKSGLIYASSTKKGEEYGKFRGNADWELKGYHAACVGNAQRRGRHFLRRHPPHLAAFERVRNQKTALFLP